jgi:hypothetical protein
MKNTQLRCETCDRGVNFAHFSFFIAAVLLFRAVSCRRRDFVSRYL